MARPTLSNSPKFKVLIRRLGLPVYAARGILELLWDAANENGDPFYKSFDEIEATCDWRGEAGELGALLLELRWIDAIEGGFNIHDYWTHAPKYVLRRAEKEANREINGEELSAKRSEAGRRGAEKRWQNNGKLPIANSKPMANDGKDAPLPLPLPLPAPAPAHLSPPLIPPAGEASVKKPTRTLYKPFSSYDPLIQRGVRWWQKRVLVPYPKTIFSDDRDAFYLEMIWEHHEQKLEPFALCVAYMIFSHKEKSVNQYMRDEFFHHRSIESLWKLDKNKGAHSIDEIEEKAKVALDRGLIERPG